MAKLSNISHPIPIATNATSRKSYLLYVTPVDYSLTDGTDIPAPQPAPSSPPRSPAPEIARPPTPGRGPLNSHPATPDDFASLRTGSFKAHEKENMAPTTTADSDKADSFRTPNSPASAAQHTSSSSPQQQARRPSGVRKLLSITNLRSSFSSSRTSLIPRPSNDIASQAPSAYAPSLKRPSSPSMASTTASTIHQPAPPRSQPQDQEDAQPQPRLRTKKSGGNWFKRKSSMFMLNSTNELDEVDESDARRPDTRDSKRVKVGDERQRSAVSSQASQEVAPARQRSPPPLIPEIGRSSFSGGDLGWDEDSFRR